MTERRPYPKRAPKPFCKYGHDIALVGRQPTSGNCRECDRIRARQWHYDNPGRIRERNLRRNYGITGEDYDRMFEQQDGRCLICSAWPREDRRLAVDHDHRTGEVRALLCDRCNRVLGLVGEDRKLLGTMVLYVEGYRP